MTTLRERLDADVKDAMRAKDALRRDVLRMTLAEIKNRDIELVGKDLSEDDVLAVVQKAVKRREEAAALYDDGGRPELAAKERSEAEVLVGYLPQVMGADETRAAVTALAAELGLTEKKQMGQLMKAVKERFGAQMDGKLASQAAGSVLT
jgi:uncharacterized protein